MPTIKQTIKEITNPHRRNDLEARRRKLGLSRVALGRILGGRPRDRFPARARVAGRVMGLCHARHRGRGEGSQAKPTLRSHKRGLDLENFFPDQLAAQGSAFTSEKMNQARRQHAREKVAGKRVAERSALGSLPREPRSTGQSEATKRTADKYIPDPDRKK